MICFLHRNYEYDPETVLIPIFEQYVEARR